MANAKPAGTNPARYRHVTLRPFQDDLAEEVRKGLAARPKFLPCKYFYDARGLALFEEITKLPEYYLTRTETGILARQAAVIINQCPPNLALAELGSGNSVKTRLLIEPCLARQQNLVYYAIDILPSALEESADRLLRAYPTLRVVGLEGEFADGIRYLGSQPGEPRLMAFLGSTIGNFTEEENARFFPMLRQKLRPQDHLLLGVDLLKDPAILLPAYDDAQGITAQFNLNVLARINAALKANFDVTAFRHRAVFNKRRSRIEMHLASVRKQTVEIKDLELRVTFQAGETIHTENCYKHSPEAMRALLARHGFRVVAMYSDPDQWFGLFLVA
jgi:L-histidine N-alpha-methyltransferase